MPNKDLEKRREYLKNYMRNRRAANTEAHEKEKARERERMREWRKANPEEAKARDKKDREIRREKRRLYAAEYNPKYYFRKKDEYKAHSAQKRAEILPWWNDYKSSLKCSRCGEGDTACLDFHHREPDKKEKHVTTMISGWYSKEKILTEIAKCDILCANCHRKEHARLKNGA